MSSGTQKIKVLHSTLMFKINSAFKKLTEESDIKIIIISFNGCLRKIEEKIGLPPC